MNYDVGKRVVRRTGKEERRDQSSAKAQEFGELWRENCTRAPCTFPFQPARTSSFRPARTNKWKAT